MKVRRKKINQRRRKKKRKKSLKRRKSLRRKRKKRMMLKKMMTTRKRKLIHWTCCPNPLSTWTTGNVSSATLQTRRLPSMNSGENLITKVGHFGRFPTLNTLVKEKSDI